MIKFNKLIGNSRRFKITFFVHLRIITVQLYFFALTIDWGKKYRDQKSKEIIDKQFNRICPICDLPVPVNSWTQEVKYHGICRKYRHSKKYDKVELRRQVTKEYPQIHV